MFGPHCIEQEGKTNLQNQLLFVLHQYFLGVRRNVTGSLGDYRRPTYKEQLKVYQSKV